MKFIKLLGLICLICFTFIYTEKIINVSIEKDEIMIKLKEVESKYKINPINATIIDNTIIPGIMGYQVDINKSYHNMKRYGKFDNSLLEYENILPSVTMNNNKDKYIISGNPDKRLVSLIFIVDENSDIGSILSILNKDNIKANFFINDKWLENNSHKLEDIISYGHVIGNLSSNFNYLDSSFLWMDTVIKKIGKQEKGYCYFIEENESELNMCSLYDNYSIKPTIINEYSYKEVKEKLVSGSILSFKINNNTIQELPIIISYIKSKGLIISNLNDMIKE